jgi:hypothetical protein
MRQRALRILVAVVVPVAVATLFVSCAPGPRPTLAAQDAADATPSDAHPPAWPSEAALQRRPRDPQGGSCAEIRHGGQVVDAGRDWPFDLESLAARSPFAAVGTVVSQRAWWHKPAVGEPVSPYGVVPKTASNFRIDRIIRGTLPSYVQTVQDGAGRDRSFPCWQWAYELTNDPLPKIGHRYVLFLQSSTRPPGFQAFYMSADRFEVIDGVVHSLIDLDPRADLTFHIEPERLERFIERVRRLPSK